MEDIYTDTVLISQDQNIFRFEFQDASIPVRVITAVPVSADETLDGPTGEIEVDYGAKITEYSNWYGIICFQNPPQEPENVSLRVEGFVYHISNQQYTFSANTTGITSETLANPLIDTLGSAELYAQWCAQYYQAKAE